MILGPLCALASHPSTQQTKPVDFFYINEFALFSTCRRWCAEVKQPLSLFEMWLLLYGHQQSGSSSSPTPEARLHHGRGLWKIHAHAVLSCWRMPPQREADTLPLHQVSVRCLRTLPNGRSQIPPYEWMRDRKLSVPRIENFCHSDGKLSFPGIEKWMWWKTFLPRDRKMNDWFQILRQVYPGLFKLGLLW